MKSILNSELGSVLEVEVGDNNNPELGGGPLRLEGKVVGGLRMIIAPKDQCTRVW